MGNSQASQPELREELSVYSLPPSETNCSIYEGLEINAVNQLTDELIQAQEASAYSMVESETNVTASDHFEPCPSMNQFNMSIYSAPKSETNVTMKEGFDHCRELAKAIYSTYTAPPSEANATLASWVGDFSNYAAPPSETNVTMAEKFVPCHSMLGKEQLGTELTAVDIESHEAQWQYVEHLQHELGICDSKVVGLKGSDGIVVKVIDSNECLQRLEQFEPIPVNF